MNDNLEQWQKDDAARLKRIFNNAGYSQAEFGDRFGIGNQAMVGQYLNADRPLNLKAAGKFASGLNCRIDDFSPELASQIRDLCDLVDLNVGSKKTANQ